MMDLKGAPYAYTPFCDSRKSADPFFLDTSEHADGEH